MKKLLKKSIQKAFTPIANKLGFEKRQKKRTSEKSTAKDDLLLNFFSILKSVGFNPKHIVDVGANKGTWTRIVLKIFPDAHYTLIEPQGWLKKDLQYILDNNSNIKFYPVGAGNKNGKLKLTTDERDDSFSFRFTEEEAKQLNKEQIEVEVVTLSDLIKKENLLVPDLIKIDAEGLDLEVLEGSKEFYGKTEVILVEAGVMNKVFSNNVLAVISYMDKNGYRLFDITDLNRTQKHNALWLVELGFVLKGGLVDKAISSYN
ncbi:FkbM family methyltransferase [Peijinzhouia sedimentorum]